MQRNRMAPQGVDFGAVGISRVARHAAQNPAGLRWHLRLPTFEHRQPLRRGQAFADDGVDPINPPGTRRTGSECNEKG